METQTRFDLNAAIADWQQELSAQPDLTPIVRRELEGHLRDTLTELQGWGLNCEESFWLARRRLGRPQQLGEEFAKADPAKVWSERAFWMALALLARVLWGASVGSFFALLLQWKTSVDFWLVNTIYLLFDWLPILIIAVLLAKGRFDFAGKWCDSFFNSRFRLAAVAIPWILVNSGLTTWHRLAMVQGPGGWSNLWSGLVFNIVWPSMLVGLLIWLMPVGSLRFQNMLEC